MAALVALLAALATATALLVRLVLAVVGGVRPIALLTKAMLAPEFYNRAPSHDTEHGTGAHCTNTEIQRWCKMDILSTV